MTAKPFSPETLAAHWGCSAEKVRLMCRDGELASFRLGKLIRIPAGEVERYECQSLTPSPCTGDDMPSPSAKTEDSDEGGMTIVAHYSNERARKAIQAHLKDQP